MKKLIFLIVIFFNFNCYSEEKKSTFNKDLFLKAQKDGKVVVINSWNKTCSTCAKQEAILKDAENDFNQILFLSFEQTVDKETAKFLEIDYWTTIVVYRNNKEVSRIIGETNKSIIYESIKKAT